MKACCRFLLLAVSILINNGSSAAFHKKLVLKGALSDAKAYPSAFVSRNTPPRIKTNLQSSSAPDFSRDTKAQRKSHQYSLGPRHYPPLHSSVPVDYDPKESPFTRAVFSSVSDRFSVLKTRGGILQQPPRRKVFQELNSIDTTRAAPVVPEAATKKIGISKLDVAVFVTYFCNLVVLTTGVVTIPAIAAEHNLSPSATAAFCASMASLAPLGGFVGKLVNGFVCQKLGGQRSSFVYMLMLSALSLGISFTKSLAPVGFFVVGFDFLCSIQWVSICALMDLNYRRKPHMKARGISILSVSSVLGALFAKTFGSVLLTATEWRTVYRVGAMTGLLGAAVMYVCGSAPKSLFEKNSNIATRVSAGGQQQLSALGSLKRVLCNPLFWLISMGHSLGHLAKVSDKLLGPMLQEIGGISSSMAVGLTSSVTIGFVIGLVRGTIFNKLDSVKGKINMIRNSYVIAGLSTFGLAACGVKTVTNMFSANVIMAAVTLLSGFIATSVSFQFYQLPNLMSTTLFPESSSVALSLADAVGFLVTAGVMGFSSLVLGAFGWSAAWAFMAVIFSMGGATMVHAMRPILIEAAKRK
mmetsp:Transcript_16452/g.41273  ORF Transcript_16452/g.41273 Transcript_16452/m.41273 type:complete len:582 (+) Transcript_16452:349-2094(+)